MHQPKLATSVFPRNIVPPYPLATTPLVHLRFGSYGKGTDFSGIGE